jgi:6-phosphogluconolactonase (cycloisomerase 2 family)
MALGAVAAASAARGAVMSGRPPRLAYTGCRTSRERNAHGDGICVWDVSGDGPWRLLQTVGGLFNPSFLAFDRTGKTLFAVHGDSDKASAWRIGPDGKLSPLGEAPTGGRNPVHLSVDPTNRFLVIANHIVADGVRSGLAVLPIAEDGRLSAPADVVALEGKTGPHRVEQPFPKPHEVAFDRRGKFIVVPDKGCDLVRVFRLDAEGKLVAVSEAKARETSGPRHVAFHPADRHAYVVNELDSTLVAYHFDPANGALAPFQVVSALPDSFTGDSRASEVEVSADGRFVYVSNRGSDTIGVFAIERATGRLTPRGWTPSGGKTPRFFALSPDGAALYAANEEGDDLVRFAVDAKSGLLSRPQVVAKTGSPTCLVFAP